MDDAKAKQIIWQCIVDTGRKMLAGEHLLVNMDDLVMLYYTSLLSRPECKELQELLAFSQDELFELLKRITKILYYPTEDFLIHMTNHEDKIICTRSSANIFQKIVTEGNIHDFIDTLIGYLKLGWKLDQLSAIQ
jgi:hypothetical protein